MKTTMLKVALATALLGMIQVAGAETASLNLNQAVAAISQGDPAKSSSQVVANAVALYKEGKISESVAVAAVTQLIGANNPAVQTLIASLIGAGANPAVVTESAVSAGTDASAVVNSAVAAGAERNVVVAAAIQAGADPTHITASSASGGERGREGRNESARSDDRRGFTPVVTPVPAGGGGGTPASRS